ncbi:MULTISPECIES: phage tail assembly protein [unclassified Acidocella]|uniref:phage tail assembly protein n=1 Tax=unclassified Acidocella TaxID=2648610 RepID=UPI0003493ADF|nr:MULTISPECIES: phage tail assembly protein [unclassified Acidocella]WBO60537.1 phage tail assembly protein [Acidocella sp. MX-AZ03]
MAKITKPAGADEDKKDLPAWLKPGDGFVDVVLSRALDLSGSKTTVLRVREVTVDDQLTVEEMKGSEARKEISLFANLCEVSPADIAKLPLRDYARLQASLGVFTD